AWLGTLLVVIVIALAPALARAAKPYGVVTVDLRPEVGEVPTHLCVVSQGKGPRTREALSELLLAPNPDDQGAPLILDPATWGGSPDDTTCDAGGACSPRIELPMGGTQDQLWVACA